MTSGSPEDRTWGPDRRAVWLLAAVAATVATSVWVVAALLMAGRGFDVSDEGFYVLSYRWWDTTPRVFTGVQYLYGPVFELLGWSIAGLRVVRLITVVLVHLVFGLAFMSWLRTRRPDAPESRSWELTGALVILASGGVTYGWLPLTPGYNDVVLLSSLVLVSLLLWSLRVVSGGRRLPVLAAVFAGPPVVTLLLAKWAAAGLILAFLLVLGVVALRSLQARGWARYVVAAVASVAGSLLLVNALVQPLGPFVSEMTEVNRLVAASTNSPLTLLGMYLSTTVSMGLEAILVAGVALLVAALGLGLQRTRFARVGLPLVALGPVAAMFAATPASWGLPGGGAAALRTYVVPLIALALVVAVASVAGSRLGDPTEAPAAAARPGRAADVAVVTMLVLLPAVQALGTGNALAYLAVNQFACWMALMVAACTVSGRPPAARALAISATACAVLLAATTGADGLLRHPYRTAAWSEATTAIGGAGPLAPVRVDAPTAERLREVREAVGEHRPGDPVMAFDEMAGMVVLLDGRSVGEAWYSRLDVDRSTAGIRSVCGQRRPWGDALPVVIYDHRPRTLDPAVLRGCGVALSRDYTIATVDQGGPPLQVYVPIAARERIRP